jgi:hypothetical protein
MSLIVDFEHSIPVNYYQSENEIIYAIYLDREFVKEFLEKSTKFQVPTFDVNHVLEVFAHPHGGFKFEREPIVPGNKIKILFRAKDPNLRDVDFFDIYWDAGTGTYQTKIMGRIDANLVSFSGRYLKSVELV